MGHAKRMLKFTSILAIVVAVAMLTLAGAGARTPAAGQAAGAGASVAPADPTAPQNSYPNPYRTVENWAQLPAGRKWGQATGIDVDRAGHIWIAERCGGATCEGHPENPILEFDSSGKLLKSFGAGMFILPHGLYVDKNNNIWVSDGQAANGRGGHDVIKFSPTGKVLMTLGKPGVPGDGPEMFNQPSNVIVAPNGDIFVADGHGGDSNARIVKYSKDGKFIKTWGKKGTGPGEFDAPHAVAFDSKGRLFVGDRGNNRVQIFDQDGNFIAEWKQFGRPSGVFIDKHDVLYVADSLSNNMTNPGWQRGIRIGSAKDGKVFAFIPDPRTDPAFAATSAAEGIVADAHGVIYTGEVNPPGVKKYVKK